MLLCLPAWCANVSRHYSLTRPGRYPDQAATFSRHYGQGPTTTIGATICVTEPPPYRSACWLSRSLRARTEEAGANELQVCANDPRHVAAAVLQSQDDSDGHGAARMKDKADL